MLLTMVDERQAPLGGFEHSHQEKNVDLAYAESVSESGSLGGTHLIPTAHLRK